MSVLCSHPVFMKSTLYLVLVTSFFFSFILASTSWWSEATSAPVCNLTSCIDLLNFCRMQIWLIWFSVLLSGDTHIALWIHSAVWEHAASDDHVVKCTKVGWHLVIFVHCVKSVSAHDYPLLYDPIFGVQVCVTLCLQFVVKVLVVFVFILGICLCTALNAAKLDIFFLSSDP